jgi:mRNA interferase HigB
MHIISRKALRDFAAIHPDAEPALDHWFRVVRKARWRRFADVRATFGSADQVGSITVFNLGGNRYRLIAVVMFEAGRVYVRHVLTHAEYDRGRWRND